MTRSQQARIEIKDFVEQKFKFAGEYNQYYMVRELMNGINPVIWAEIDANENVAAIPTLTTTHDGFKLTIDLIEL